MSIATLPVRMCGIAGYVRIDCTQVLWTQLYVVCAQEAAVVSIVYASVQVPTSTVATLCDYLRMIVCS